MARLDPDRLEELLAGALAAHDAGGEEALQAFLAAHPAERRTIERGLARARQLGLAGERAPAADFPERLGEFRLLRRLGSGGMGVVYEAEQQSLSRRVALKLVRPELLYFEGARERFRREIEAVARLQHPAIVPVLASGEQDGVPYYAMELLHGSTLHELTQALRGRDPGSLRGRDPGSLRGRDLRQAFGGDASSGSDALDGPWWQAATRIALAIALGVRHAHLRGIVHRDIKPSNVMLTRDGRTVLLDFGVALVGGGAQLTRTGNTPGSPAFMSPEQLRGDAVDERTDVYSLAATLWQLLTLEPPFAHQGELQRILQGDVPSVLSRNREVPHELALVVRTAMDVDRQRRYPDMQSLADDLGAVLQRRPIRARRLPAGLRLLRWAQRHRTAATALACAMGGALLLPAVIAVRERATSAELALLVQRADHRLDVALETIRSLLVRVGEERLRYVPAARAAAIASLQEACARYRELLAEVPDHERMRIDAGKALSRLADLLARDGQHDAALAALDEGVDILGGIRADVPPALRNARVFLQVNRASLLGRVGNAAAAGAALAQAETDLAGLAGLPRFDLDQRRNAIQCLLVRATLGDDAARERIFRTALPLAREVAGHRGRVDDDLRAVVNLLDDLATVLAHNGRGDEALPLLDEALVLARSLPADARIWPPQPMLVASVLQTLGNLLVERRDLAAVPALKECLELREQVARDHPSDLYARSDLAGALHNLARLNFEQAQDDLVVERLDRAIDLQRQVLAGIPEFTQARDYLINHLTLRGSALAKLGRRADLERNAAALADFADVPLARRRAARLWLRCVQLLDAESPPPADAATRRTFCVDQALHNLLAAERAGWGTGSALGDRVYDPLRELPEFQALQQRIAARQGSVSPPSTSSASREMPR